VKVLYAETFGLKVFLEFLDDHRDHEGRERLGRRDGVGAGLGEWHQPGDPPGQPDPLEADNEGWRDRRRGDGFGGGGEPDLPSGEDGITRGMHRLVKGCGVRLFDTTLLPHGL
jgi:hypothetical protein